MEDAREKLIEAMKGYQEVFMIKTKSTRTSDPEGSFFDYMVSETFRRAAEELKRSHGSWLYGTECSACHKTIIPPKDRKLYVNFCPYCGCDMR